MAVTVTYHYREYCNNPALCASLEEKGLVISEGKEVARSLPCLLYTSFPLCQSLARPNILMFGDWGWLSERSDAQDVRLQALSLIHI